MTKYIIIGNSTAAIGAIEGIRSLDTTSPITLFSSENHHTYSRPLISYLLENKTTLEKMKYRDDNFYELNNVTVVYEKIVKINSDKKQVYTEANKEFSYDKLLVATGSRPFVPPTKGLDSVKKYFTFMSLDDALDLEKVANSTSKVLIIGAGLIGLKCAECLQNKVNKITVIDLADRILSSILDKDASEFMQKHLEKNGINFILSQAVTSFNGNVAQIGDKNVEFDILVMAVGVRAQTELIRDIGGTVNRGIYVDTKMQTSIADIYSAGDCTEIYDISCDKVRPLPLLPNAYIGGNCAGINMAGGEMVFDNAIPMNSIGLFGLHIITAGSYIGDIKEIQVPNGYKKLFYQDNYLKGYIVVGEIERAGIYTSLIRNKTPLDSIDFDLIAVNPTLIAFEKKVRKTKLGGKV
ncbi:MAG: FAD-dependent oxidoreductase [Clostridia bacterium]